MNHAAIAIRQITDWRHVEYGTHYVLKVGDWIVARAVNGMTLADLKRKYRALKAVRS